MAANFQIHLLHRPCPPYNPFQCQQPFSKYTEKVWKRGSISRWQALNSGHKISTILIIAFKRKSSTIREMLPVVVFLGTAAFLLQSCNALSSIQPELLTTSVFEEEDPSKLFAVIGGDSCANTLFYGPQDVNKWGSVDGQHPHYFSTTAGSVPHDTWLQVVTDGTREFFRIYWYFTSDKTVQQRLVDAVSVGEKVTYKVVYTSLVSSAGVNQYYTGTWRFSSNSGITATQLATSTSKCCLSANGGVFGADKGTIDGGFGYASSSFWGMGNFGSDDPSNCFYMFVSGDVWNPKYTNSKSYMYFDTFQPPTFAPTSAPIGGVYASMRVRQDVIGASWYDYSLNQLGFTNVFTDAVVAVIPGIKESEVRDMIIFHEYGRRQLQHHAVVGTNESSAAPQPGLRIGGNHRGTLAGRCTVQYYVTAPYRQGISYTEMSQALQNSLGSNQFTTYMQAFAVQQNVPALQTATSPSASVDDFSTTSKPKSAGEEWHESTAAIAGISTGCLILLFCVLVAICGVTKRSSNMGPSAFGYSNPPGVSPVPYNVPPAQGMVSSQDPGYSTVNAGVELPGVYSGGGVKASAPPAASSSSFLSFGRSDPSHTRW